jgi:hypothetical protein
MAKIRGVTKLSGKKLKIYGKGKGYLVGKKPRFLLKPKMDIMFEVKDGKATNITKVPRVPGHRRRQYE